MKPNMRQKSLWLLLALIAPGCGQPDTSGEPFSIGSVDSEASSLTAVTFALTNPTVVSYQDSSYNHWPQGTFRAGRKDPNTYGSLVRFPNPGTFDPNRITAATLVFNPNGVVLNSNYTSTGDNYYYGNPQVWWDPNTVNDYNPAPGVSWYYPGSDHLASSAIPYVSSAKTSTSSLSLSVSAADIKSYYSAPANNFGYVFHPRDPTNEITFYTPNQIILRLTCTPLDANSATCPVNACGPTSLNDGCGGTVVKNCGAYNPNPTCNPNACGPTTLYDGCGHPVSTQVCGQAPYGNMFTWDGPSCKCEMYTTPPCHYAVSTSCATGVRK